MVHKQRLRQLLELRIREKITANEEQELSALLADAGNEALVQEVLDELYDALPETYQLSEQAGTGMFRRVMEQAREEAPAEWPAPAAVKNRKPLLVLCCTAVLLATGAWWLLRDTTTAPPVTAAVKTVTHDVAPGGNKATLTLADGSTIVLDDAGNGTLQQQGSTTIRKPASGQLTYSNNSTAANGTVLYNTIVTPRGGQYQVQLPDGTRVWLNAASTLRFPTAFTGADRTVEFSGEAYFEVAHHNGQAFSVKVNETTVQVLGTHFNINAYADEKHMHTTLLEGAVKVRSGSQEALLQPGQDAAVPTTGTGIEVKETDVNNAIAWKNGIFFFHNDDIATVMRQLGRWYNVEISYVGPVPAHRFEGRIWRNYTLAQTLAVLQASDVHFKIDNRKLVVLP